MNSTAQRLLPAGLIALILHISFLYWQYPIGQVEPQLRPSKKITISLGGTKMRPDPTPASKPRIENQPTLPVEKKIAPVKEPKLLPNNLPQKRATPHDLVKKPLVSKVRNKKKQPEKKTSKQVAPPIQKAASEILVPVQPPAQEKIVPQPEPSELPVVDQQTPLQAQSVIKEKNIKTTIEAKPLYNRNPKPKYPSRARRKGWQGTVLFEVEVLADGSVGQIDLHKSSGYKTLDKAGLAAVKKWYFVPGMVDGKVQTMKVLVPLKFSLQ